MTTALRLSRELYADDAIEGAIRIYAGHAQIARADEGNEAVLTLSSDRPGRADRVARELANYALGLTIQGRKSPAGETR